MKLVFVTQELDPSHPALAQTTDLVEALAARVDELAIVARDVEWSDVPANAAVRTFASPRKLGRGLQFEQSLHASLGGADAVLVHMVPEFAVLAAPEVRIRRIPFALWYTHWHGGRALRAATGVVDVVFSVDRSSFPLDSPKIREIGHAIDVERFALAPLVGARGAVAPACARTNGSDGRASGHSSKQSLWRSIAAPTLSSRSGGRRSLTTSERTAWSSRDASRATIRCAAACRSCRPSPVKRFPHSSQLPMSWSVRTSRARAPRSTRRCSRRQPAGGRS